LLLRTALAAFVVVAPAALAGSLAAAGHGSSGEGKVEVAPSTLAAGRPGNALTFLFTADTGALNGQLAPPP
jgi:hypothetical protein